MSSPRPLVSILINNYNYGRFLREAIDSARVRSGSRPALLLWFSPNRKKFCASPI